MVFAGRKKLASTWRQGLEGKKLDSVENFSYSWTVVLMLSCKFEKNLRCVKHQINIGLIT